MPADGAAAPPAAAQPDAHARAAAATVALRGAARAAPQPGISAAQFHPAMAGMPVTLPMQFHPHPLAPHLTHAQQQQQQPQQPHLHLNHQMVAPGSAAQNDSHAMSGHAASAALPGQPLAFVNGRVASHALYLNQQRRIQELEFELAETRAENLRFQALLAERDRERASNTLSQTNPAASAQNHNPANTGSGSEDPKKTTSRYWTPEEHTRFLEGLEQFGHKDIKAISNHVGTRNATQVRTHAQKYYLRLSRESAKQPSSQGAPPSAPPPPASSAPPMQRVPKSNSPSSQVPSNSDSASLPGKTVVKPHPSNGNNNRSMPLGTGDLGPSQSGTAIAEDGAKHFAPSREQQDSVPLVRQRTPDDSAPEFRKRLKTEERPTSALLPLAGGSGSMLPVPTPSLPRTDSASRLNRASPVSVALRQSAIAKQQSAKIKQETQSQSQPDPPALKSVPSGANLSEHSIGLGFRRNNSIMSLLSAKPTMPESTSTDRLLGLVGNEQDDRILNALKQFENSSGTLAPSGSSVPRGLGERVMSFGQLAMLPPNLDDLEPQDVALAMPADDAKWGKDATS